MFDKQYAIDRCLILWLSTATHCQYIYCLHEFSFNILMNRCFFRYESMKNDEISRNQDIKSINKTSVSSISTAWPIQSNQIYRFSAIYRLTNWYLFLSIDYSGIKLFFLRVAKSNLVFLGQTNYRDKLGWDY